MPHFGVTRRLVVTIAMATVCLENSCRRADGSTVDEAALDVGSCQSRGPSAIEVYSATQLEMDQFSMILSQTMKEQLVWRQSTQQHANTAQAFNLSSFFAMLSTARLGHVVLYNSTLSSTQTLLYEDFSVDHDGLLCLADRQSAAKGRGQNKWDSPIGCLVFSFTSRTKPSNLPFFQYVVAMAIYKAVSKLAGGDAKELLGLQLKWPNDIYGPDRKKLGGILCQSSGRPGGVFDVVAGIGLNVHNAQPTISLHELFVAAGLPAAEKLSREAVLAIFCAEFEALHAALENEGFAGLAAEYTRMWMHSGQDVEVQAADGSDRAARKATIRGVSASGYLLAVDEQEQELELHPDGNSLDMMKGLIYQKR